MHVARSVKIKADAQKIIHLLTNFNQWKHWSPWLLMDPEARVIVSDDTRYYEWQGERVGSGKMQVMDVVGLERVRCDLEFLTPWKSKAEVNFYLNQQQDGSVDLTWDMNSHLPFFLFWMKKQMEAYVGMDYLRGLYMFKDLCELGEVPSRLEFLGDEPFDGTEFVGIRRRCSMQALSEAMSADLARLETFMAQHEAWRSEGAFSIYHRWDAVKGEVEYTSAIAVKPGFTEKDNQMISGRIPPVKVYRLRHTGPYRHLGNAWSTLYSMQRRKEFKMMKGQDPFELYESQPGNGPEKDIRTTVCFPIQ